MTTGQSKLRKAIIIDDNELIRMTLRAALRRVGIDVVGEAADGDKGLSMVERHEPDLVFLDIQMPRRSGLEVLAEIRAARPETKVVMVTGHSHRDIVRSAISGGAQGFIVKPFNQRQIEQTLSRISW